MSHGGPRTEIHYLDPILSVTRHFGPILTVLEMFRPTIVLRIDWLQRN